MFVLPGMATTATRVLGVTWTPGVSGTSRSPGRLTGPGRAVQAWQATTTSTFTHQHRVVCTPARCRGPLLVPERSWSREMEEEEEEGEGEGGGSRGLGLGTTTTRQHWSPPPPPTPPPSPHPGNQPPTIIPRAPAPNELAVPGLRIYKCLQCFRLSHRSGGRGRLDDGWTRCCWTS